MPIGIERRLVDESGEDFLNHLTESSDDASIARQRLNPYLTPFTSP